MIINTIELEKEIARQKLTYKETASRAGIVEKTLKAARDGKSIRIKTAGSISNALNIPFENILKK